ncbi:MAG: CvpA family protein, partial [Thermomicrobiales bacterium]|nr:CvpA family protein [Thermomicrobiales bacterium]
MSIYIVLDILLVLLILLLTPIGFWRGPVKELFVTLGILFGVLISDYWARPWGNDLADMTSLTPGAGAFLVAMIFLITSTFVLGYGLGATLAPARHNTMTRVLGAGVAALNGALILSFALQYIRLFLLSDINEESLNKSAVTRFLLNDIGWILLVAAIVAIPVLIYVLATGYRVYALSSDDPRIYTTTATPIAGRGRGNTRETANPPRVPVSSRGEHPAYKAEPPVHEQPVSRETRPVVVTE